MGLILKINRDAVQKLALRAGAVSIKAPQQRRRMGILKALAWAYRDELIKTPRDETLRGPEPVSSGWSAVSAQGDLRAETVHDGTSALVNKWGVVPDFLAQQAPHPDALRIAEAVHGLDAFEMDVPETWCTDIGLRAGVENVLDTEWPAAAGRALNRVWRESSRRLVVPLSLIIIHAATSGKPPVWRNERIARRFICQANGKPAWFVRVAVEDGLTCDGEQRWAEVERDGMCARTHRPLPGAYRKEIMEPDPADLLLERARYELWRAALNVLVEELQGLESIAVQPCNISYRPWLGRAEPVQRILGDDRPVFVPAKKVPVRAGPRAKRPSWPLNGTPAKKKAHPS